MKRTIEDLARFGGRPLFAEALHVGRPNIPDRAVLLNQLEDCLDRRWLTNDGPLVREFEQRIAELIDVRHCIAMSSGTTALEIASRALDLSGEVIVPAFTFVATAHALQWQQITPVFCDIDPETHSIEPAQIESLITPKTTGIIGVHLWGRGCRVSELAAIARRHNLKLMFDASHAFGCSAENRLIGGFGDAEVFSFHATKFVSTLEGGIVTTNSDELAHKMRLMRNFGFETYDSVIHVGVNGKMNEFEAAFGLGCLESMNEFLEVNRANFVDYQATFDNLPGITLKAPPAGERSNYQYILCDIDSDECPLSRDELLDLLWEENLRVRRYFHPGCHRMEPYLTLDPHAGRRLPHTEQACRRALQFPTGTSIGSSDIVQIGELIQFLLQNAVAIRQAL